MRWFFVARIARHQPAQFAQIGQRALEPEAIRTRLAARIRERVAHLDQAVLDERNTRFQVDQAIRGGRLAHGLRTERPRPMP